MTRQEAISRANEMGGAAIARPYDPDNGIWGVTDRDNYIVPKKGTVEFQRFQMRFMEW